MKSILFIALFFTKVCFSQTPSGVTVAGGNMGGNASNQFNTPLGVFVDNSGIIYVSDYLNHRIQKWLPGALSGITIAGGNGQGSSDNQLDEPIGVFLDNSGNIYISDAKNHRVQKWLPGAASGITVAGGNGQGSAANQLSYPNGVFVDNLGNIYISDLYNSRIQKWLPGAAAGITVAGGNGLGSESNQFADISGIFLDVFGNIYASDVNNYRIQKWEPGATTGITVAGGNGRGFAANQLDSPYGVFVDNSGNIYVCEYYNHRITKWVHGATSGITVAGGNGQGNAANQLFFPTGIFLNNSGDIFVSDLGNYRVQKFSPIIANVSTLVSNTISSNPSFFISPANFLISSLNPAGTAPVAGLVVAKVWIDASQGSKVKRHFEIIPDTNPTSATGKVTLYFTQSDFTDYNNQSTSPSNLLPTNPTDATGIANLKIEKRSGTSDNGSGNINTYTLPGILSTIDPADSDIVWNAITNRWEVSFDVQGFGGFWVNSVLPLVAKFVLAPSAPTPLGTLPSANIAPLITGTSPNIITSVTIPLFPAGATSITIGANTYLANDPIWLSGGITLSTNATGTPAEVITIDPEAVVATTILVTFQLKDASGQTSANSVAVPFSNPTALPITLVNFSGNPYENVIVLNWKTENEKDFSHFEITRSGDAKEFGSIGSVVGGNINGIYNFTDNNPNFEATNYYRLKMVDKAGASELSKIVTVNFDKSEKFLSVQNPANNGEFMAITNVENPKFYMVNSLGATIKIGVNSISANKYAIHIKSPVAGIYLLNLEVEGKLLSRKVLVP